MPNSSSRRKPTSPQAPGTRLSGRAGSSPRRKAAFTAAAAVAWLAVWEVAARAVGHDVLLVGPLAVAARLVELAPQGSFWATVGYSLARIAAGFLLALALGSALAWLSRRGALAAALVGVPMAVVRAVPVVSFIVLVLIWAGSKALTVSIACVMVLPIVFANVQQGLAARDPLLAEFAQVFGLSRWRRWRAVTVPALGPFLAAACRAGAGQAWKAGVSAEVIGLPTGSIGERLYQAKLYLSSADLFAWTLVIVALSFGLERLALLALRGAGLPRAQAAAGTGAA
jgi:NitT/TauT family transport system permease protein